MKCVLMELMVQSNDKNLIIWTICYGSYDLTGKGLNYSYEMDHIVWFISEFNGAPWRRSNATESSNSPAQ